MKRAHPILHSCYRREETEIRRNSWHSPPGVSICQQREGKGKGDGKEHHNNPQGPYPDTKAHMHICDAMDLKKKISSIISRVYHRAHLGTKEQTLTFLRQFLPPPKSPGLQLQWSERLKYHTLPSTLRTSVSVRLTLTFSLSKLRPCHWSYFSPHNTLTLLL